MKKRGSWVARKIDWEYRKREEMKKKIEKRKEKEGSKDEV